MMKFAIRLKELRIERKLSQTTVANATGLSQNAIAQWENEKRIPNAIVLSLLSQYFGVSSDYLLGLTDDL